MCYAWFYLAWLHREFLAGTLIEIQRIDVYFSKFPGVREHEFGLPAKTAVVPQHDGVGIGTIYAWFSKYYFSHLYLMPSSIYDCSQCGFLVLQRTVCGLMSQCHPMMFGSRQCGWFGRGFFGELFTLEVECGIERGYHCVIEHLWCTLEVYPGIHIVLSSAK